MGEIPTTKNNWAASLNGVAHTIFTLGLTAGKETIKTYLPWLRLPVISWIFDLIVNRFGDAIDQEIQMHLTFLVIDIQTANELKAYQAATEELKKANETKDQDAINKAKEEFKKKLADLVHFDGST